MKSSAKRKKERRYGSGKEKTETLEENQNCLGQCCWEDSLEFKCLNMHCYLHRYLMGY